MFTSELPTTRDRIDQVRLTDCIAAALLALVALSLASIGWATFVLPSVRSISPDQISSATRASSLAPILLALGGSHAIGAALALSNRRQARRLLSVGATVGAIAASAVTVLVLAGNPLAGWSGATALSPMCLLAALSAAGYGALATFEHRSTIR